MIDIEITATDTQLLDEYVAVCAEGGQDFINTATPITVNRVAEDALAPLRTEPGPPHYPIDWQKPKQRRAYFASNGFGMGIPYVRRKSGLPDFWKIFMVQENNLPFIWVANSDPAADFVVGHFQQRMHIATGWPNAYDLANDVAEALTDALTTDLIKAWYAIGD